MINFIRSNGYYKILILNNAASAEIKATDASSITNNVFLIFFSNINNLESKK